MEVEQLGMDLPSPELTNKLLTNVMRVPHVRFGHMEDNVHTGAGDGDTDVGGAGVTWLGAGAGGDGLDTVRVQVRVVEQQVGPENSQS